MMVTGGTWSTGFESNYLQRRSDTRFLAWKYRATSKNSNMFALIFANLLYLIELPVYQSISLDNLFPVRKQIQYLKTF